ncbi:MAG TPA: transporter [Vicinamibacterales bacterium]|jgi:hypothetical protein|nr:transporter [Vicinamibacterales bacterium]
MKATERVAIVFSALFIAASTVSAQTVAGAVTFLMTNQSVATGSPARDQAAAQAASDAVGWALLASLATLPVTSSAGSFTYHLNSQLGTPERADGTFGPFFVERALTIGRNQASAGVSFQHLELSSLDGRNLRDGTLVTTANQFADESTPFDVDRLRLNIAADVATIYGAFGLTDRLDIGAALPLVSLRIDGSRVDTYRGTDFQQATASASTVGAADAVVRAKYLWWEDSGKRFATSVDLRVPTGKKENFLGAGSAAVAVSGLGSLARGSWSAHANAGVSVGGFAREISYGAAIALAATRRLTISGEVLGRWIDGAGQLTTATAADPVLAGVNTIRLTSTASWLHIATAVPGLKWNVSDTWVLLANVSLPLTNGGLTAPATPFIGIDYAFGSIF